MMTRVYIMTTTYNEQRMRRTYLPTYLPTHSSHYDVFSVFSVCPSSETRPKHSIVRTTKKYRASVRFRSVSLVLLLYHYFSFVVSLESKSIFPLEYESTIVFCIYTV